MSVGFEHTLDAKSFAQLQQLFVLVGRVYLYGVTRATTPHDENIVVKRPDHHFVHIYIGVAPVQSWVRI
jgi:hypothetical protein